MRAQFRVGVAVLLAGASLGGLVSAQADPPDPNPALQLHLDRYVGDGTTQDSSPSGLTAMATGVSGDGRWDQGLTPTSYGSGVRVPDDTALRPSTLTLVAWVKRSGTPGANRIVVGKQGLTPEAGEVPCAGYSYGLITGPAGGLRFTLRTDQTTDVESETPELSPTAVWDGNWHMIAGTWNGSAMQLWVDGVAQGAPTTVGSFPILQGDGDTYPADLMGAWADHGAVDSCDASGAQYTGSLDEIRLYPRALTSDELAYLARPDLTTPPDLANPQPSPTTSTSSTSTSTPSASSTTTTSVTHSTTSTPPPAIQLFKQDVLRATGTGNLPILWDLNGDGKPDVTCPANEPYLKLTPDTSQTARIVVTSGGLSSPPTTVQLVGLGVPQADRTITADSAVCGTLLAVTISPPKAVKHCSPGTASFGLAEVRGCFVQLDSIDDVDPAVRRIMQDHYDSVELPSWVVTACLASGAAAKAVCAQETKVFKTVDVYESTGAVSLNGITIDPGGGGAVVVAPNLQRIVSAGASLRWGGIAVQGRQPVDLNLASTYKVSTLRGSSLRPVGRAPLLDFDAKRDLPDIGGFKLDGTASLGIEDTGTVRRSYANISVRLPDIFTLFGGKPPTGGTTLYATNDSPPAVGVVDISVPEADIGPLVFTQVSFHYNAAGDPASGCPRKYWKATARLQLPGTGTGPGAGFSLAPPPPDNGVVFCAGAFKGAGATITFGAPIPPPQVFPSVFLTYIHFSVFLDPLVFNGGAGFNVAGLVDIDGTLLAAFPTPSKPYRLTAANGGALAMFAPRTFTTPAFGVGGSASVNLPVVGKTHLADAGVLYVAPDDVSIGGHITLHIPALSLDGTVGGRMIVSKKLYQFYGGIHACVAGIACAGAQGWVGSVGMVVCLNLFGWSPGAGYAWHGGLHVFSGIGSGNGCRPSRYWTQFPAGSAQDARAAARTGYTFTVARGETTKSVRIGGVGGPPMVHVRGPRGEVLDANGTTFQHSRTIGAVRSPQTNYVLLDIKDALPGRYTVTALPGSVPLNGLWGTRPGYDTDFRAKVLGHGARRVLVYDARKPSGQRVRFYEQGPSTYHLLGSSTGGKGRIVFTPAPGTGGTRSIYAVATLDGAPIPDETLAHFRVATTPSAGRPARVTLRRKGTALVIRWSRATGASRYGIVLTGTAGTQRRFTRSSRVGTLTVRGFPVTQGVQAAVAAANVLGAWGKPRSSRAVRALHAPPSVLQKGSKRKTKR